MARAVKTFAAGILAFTFLLPSVASADLLKSAGKGLGKATKKVKDGTKDAAKDTVKGAKDAANATESASEKATRVTKSELGKVGDWTKKGFAATMSTLKKGFAGLTDASKALFNKVVSITGDTIGKLLSPAVKSITDAMKSVAKGAKASTSKSSTDSVIGALPLAKMAALFGEYFAKAVKLGVLQMLTGKLTKTWQYLKNSGNFAVQGKGGASVPDDFSPKSFADSVKSKLKASVVGIAAFAAVAEALIQFPTAYLVAAGACVSEAKGGARSRYRNCYLKNFVAYAKSWLFDAFIGVGLSPLDATLIPAASTTLGGTVSALVATAIAAMTGGVGVAVAPFVGAIVAVGTAMGLKMLVAFAAKAAFYDLYEQTSWKASCGFFETLVSKDVLDHFGPKSSGAGDDDKTTTFCP